MCVSQVQVHFNRTSKHSTWSATWRVLDSYANRGKHCPSESRVTINCKPPPQQPEAPPQEDMTLVGIGTAAPGVNMTNHTEGDALKAKGAGRGHDFAIDIGL
jgi:hypothetical protein